MTRVKICGITRTEDAVLAAGLGAFAVGFVFWPKSPRCVSTETARAAGAALPPHVLKVGVFVNQPCEEVRRVSEAARLDVIQLHGDETVEYIRRLERRVFKAVPVSGTIPLEMVETLPEAVTVLLDVHDPERRGGTGRTIDWSIAAAASARRPIVLSGGITPENIRAAIAAVRPFAVDVSSGVEASPGTKAPERLRALFEAIRHD